MIEYDVVIVGAGLSGIGMACHLAREAPGIRFGLLERRQRIGGTWDLFRYPGIRSDSDMFTFGYAFRLWKSDKTLADANAIRQYVEDTAAEYGVQDKIRFGLRVTKASWSSERNQWTLHALEEASGQTHEICAPFVIFCTGYYSHDAGYQPEFPGRERFSGEFIHPQHWPEELDYRGKRAIIVGSGATAVTLVPSMVRDGAGHVTMLQRSPSYIMTIPSEDALVRLMRRFLPEERVLAQARTRSLWIQRKIYKVSRRWPKLMRKFLLRNVRKQVGPNVDMRHFTPDYQPWDQRLCLVPNGDLFQVLREGKASIVTDRIETFTEHGIRLQSGTELEADIIISATGLRLEIFGGTAVEVDGTPVQIRDRVTYKGVLAEGVPNAGFVFGYTNLPWTLRADLVSSYLCRLLNHMRANGFARVTPNAPAQVRLGSSILDSMQSGYVQRGDAVLPRQGRDAPWRVVMDYNFDGAMLGQPIEDDALSFQAEATTETTR